MHAQAHCPYTSQQFTLCFPLCEQYRAKYLISDRLVLNSSVLSLLSADAVRSQCGLPYSFVCA